MSAQYLPPKRRILTIYSYLAVGPEGVNVQTTDEHIHAAAISKKEKGLGIEEWIASACIACHDMIKEEHALQKKFISSGKTPPLKTHIQCRTCETDLVPNLILQAGLGYKCSDILMKPPKKGKKVVEGDIEYLLDPDTGNAWYTVEEKTELLRNPLKIRVLWSRILK